MRGRAVAAGVIVTLIVGAVAGGAWWWWDREHTRDAAARAVIAAYAAGYTARDLRKVPFVDATAAAGFTTTFAGMGAATVSATPGPVTRTETRAESEVAVTWTLPDRTLWRYTVTVHVVDRPDGSWAVGDPDHGSLWSRDLGPHDTVSLRKVEGARGNLLDTNGDPLMPEGDVYPVQIDPGRATVATVRSLERLVGVPAGSLVAKLRAAQKAGSQAPIPVINYRQSDFDRLRSRLDALTGVIYPRTTQPLAVTRTFGQPLLGTFGPVTAEIVKDSNGRYAAGDRAGLSGLQLQYDATLAGSAAYTVVSSTGAVLHTAQPTDGQDVRTTLDPGVQTAAEDALTGAGAVPAALVAIDVPSGGVLAVANSPTSGFDRALTGQYAPGSAFKIATTYAYLTDGVTTPSSSVACPPTVVVDGKSFRNYEGESLGTPTFADDFAQSCNTAFIGLSGSLAPSQLTTAARALGVGGGWGSTLGVDGTFAGSVPPANGATDQAAAAIGQGRVEVSPVALADLAASVARGSSLPPTLVLPPTQDTGAGGPGPSATASPSPTATPLDPSAVGQLRTLMRGVVTGGTGSALQGTPGGPVFGKTGTAEFGTATPPQTHAWFIGYQGSVAFAVLVEEGASGGSVAAPIAKAFLTALAH